MYIFHLIILQGLKNTKTKTKTKNSPVIWGTEVDFPTGQATFLAHLPTGQSPRQEAHFNPITKWKLDFRFFLA